MKRYYLSPIVGTGTEEDPYRPKIADYGVSWSCVISSDELTGQPKRPWCVAVVEAADHATLLADTTLDAIPNISLDTLVSSLSKTIRDKLKTRLDALGVDTRGLSIDDPIRLWVRAIGRHIEPAFHESRFGVL